MLVLKGIHPKTLFSALHFNLNLPDNFLRVAYSWQIALTENAERFKSLEQPIVNRFKSNPESHLLLYWTDRIETSLQ